MNITDWISDDAIDICVTLYRKHYNKLECNDNYQSMVRAILGYVDMADKQEDPNLVATILELFKSIRRPIAQKFIHKQNALRIIEYGGYIREDVYKDLTKAGFYFIRRKIKDEENPKITIFGPHNYSTWIQKLPEYLQHDFLWDYHYMDTPPVTRWG